MIPLVPPLLELGELLPDVAPGPQSFIAVCEPLVLLPLEFALGLVDEPLALGLLEPELEPAVEPVVLPLELVEPEGLFIAVELPGPQSVRPLFSAPLVPVLLLAPGLVLVEPPVLVCASAAVPSDRARIDAAVRTRRFIRYPPCISEASLGTLPGGKLPGAATRSGLAAKSPNTERRTTRTSGQRKRAASKCGPSSGRKSPKDLQCAPEDRPRTAGKE